jgi:excinuclease ABC subunit A
MVITGHNYDIILHSNWVMDMLPDGDKKEVALLIEGVPEDLVKCRNSCSVNILKYILRCYAAYAILRI